MGIVTSISFGGVAGVGAQQVLAHMNNLLFIMDYNHTLFTPPVNSHLRKNGSNMNFILQNLGERRLLLHLTLT